MYLFFFNQKTASEMRISDWSSDVCSSDLVAVIRDRALNGGHKGYLVSNDQTAALIIAELQEFDPITRQKLDYLDLSARLEKQVREKFEDDKTSIEDRNSIVEGKRGKVRVDLGGRRLIQQKQQVGTR